MIFVKYYKSEIVLGRVQVKRHKIEVKKTMLIEELNKLCKLYGSDPYFRFTEHPQMMREYFHGLSMQRKAAAMSKMSKSTKAHLAQK